MERHAWPTKWPCKPSVFGPAHRTFTTRHARSGHCLVAESPQGEGGVRRPEAKYQLVYLKLLSNYGLLE